MLTALAVMGCEKVDQPLKNELGFIELPDSTSKVVLLEEFTGADCNNCPPAAERAQEYLQSFPGKVVIVSIHEGNFAVPDAEHPIDYRVPVGTELFKFFKPYGVPAGLFDRLGYPEDEHINLFGKWNTAFTTAIAREASLDITANFVYDTTDQNFSVRANIRAIDEVPDANLYLSVYLLEDSIVSPQTMPNGSIKEDYVHNHMLRASFNGAFGTEITTGTISAGEIITRNFSLKKEPEWNAANCSAAIFVYDRNTYEVIQAHSTHFDH